jgi:aerobic-type carbon monoxide dehydrogenase small subunit (CoxS/CutS family)
VITLPLQLEVNGQSYELEVEPHLTLLEALRNHLGLTGTKEGCSTGHCGACTVLVNGQPLATGGKLHPVQAAFVAAGGLQCGFCTAGMMMSTIALFNRNPQPTEREIRMSLAGNLCRCTGYHKIVEAVKSAAEELYHERA